MIYLPPPQPVLNKDIRVSGDVEIHPTASLAPGVILQAAPNHRIVIGADVCIGMGVIISASEGSIEIESGAILGAGVLIIGASKIGNNACIGASSTILQQDVAAMVVMEPGSIIGDNSRQVDLDDTSSDQKEQANHQSEFQPQQTQAKQNKTPKATYYYKNSPTPQNQTEAKNTAHTPNSASIPEVETVVESSISKQKAPVVGQVYINELLVTLFPHNKEQNSQTKSLE